MRVDADSASSASSPVVIGRYSVVDGRIRFEPHFPFASGVAYRVDVDTAALADLDASEVTFGSTPLVHRFALAGVERHRTTRVLGVSPSATQLPANLLRWYVELSAPMEVGAALAHVSLLDEAGREVKGAFLALDQELWDPDRRRITLLFDPGRVKRGVRTNVDEGAPLVAGRRYKLVVDEEWVDGAGAPLASGFDHAFEAIDADRRSPDPAQWSLTTPPAGTANALRVVFGEGLDHALAVRMVTVHDASGSRVAGGAELSASDSVWTFTPSSAWAAGEYTLRIDARLEDIAGNSVARLFDVDRLKGGASVETSGEKGEVRTVSFRISR